MKNLPLDDEASSGSSTSRSMVMGLLLTLGTPVSILAQDSGGSGMDPQAMVAALAVFVLIIAVLVLMVAIYTLSLLKVAMQKEEPEVESVTRKEKQWSWFWDRFNKMVPPEREETILLDHNYDGIRELDNHLPPWWTAFFYISIVFGVIYMFVYHVFNVAPLPGELYNISVAEAEAAAIERLAEAGEEGGGID